MATEKSGDRLDKTETEKEPTEAERLGDRLRKVRKETGLNQTDFGDMVGISQTIISALECNHAKLSKTGFLAIEYKTRAKKEWLRTGIGAEHLYPTSGKTDGRVSDEDKDLQRIKSALSKIQSKFRSDVSTQIIAFIDLFSKTPRKR